MIAIIAGGRDCRFTDDDFDRLEAIHQKTPITEVVCGGAEGADEYGRQWAILNGITVKMFPADWDNHGKRAGPIRNAKMANYLLLECEHGCSVAVILFPGGRGTQSMWSEAVKRGLPIFDWRERSVE